MIALRVDPVAVMTDLGVFAQSLLTPVTTVLAAAHRSIAIHTDRSRHMRGEWQHLFSQSWDVWSDRRGSITFGNSPEVHSANRKAARRKLARSEYRHFSVRKSIGRVT